MLNLLANKLLRWLRGFECEMCHFKSRNKRKIDLHVAQFWDGGIPQCYWVAVDKFTQSQSSNQEDVT